MSDEKNSSNELEMITLQQLCTELDVKPATARRKLRNKFKKSEGDFRWEFTEEQANEVRAILMAKPDKKEAKVDEVDEVDEE